MDAVYAVGITLMVSMVGIGIMWEIVEDYSLSNPF